jgi:hypothetical protein
MLEEIEPLSKIAASWAIGAALSLLAGCAALPPVPAPAPGDAVVAVIERGWHTDIGLPADRIGGRLAPLAEAWKGAGYLVFGFGDREYYMAREVTFGQTIEALFPGPGVILVTGLGTSPEAAFGTGNVVMLHVPQAGFDRIADFVAQALDERGDGTIRLLGDGPYPGSLFYASGDIYDAFDNCNGWTARALRRGGLPVDPDPVLFSDQVMDQARTIAAAQNERKS